MVAEPSDPDSLGFLVRAQRRLDPYLLETPETLEL